MRMLTFILVLMLALAWPIGTLAQVNPPSPAIVDASSAVRPNTGGSSNDGIQVHTSVSTSTSISSSSSSSSSAAASARNDGPLAPGTDTMDNRGDRSGRGYSGDAISTTNSTQISQDANAVNTTAAVPSRRLTSIDRDNKKLMSVLAARRQEQGGKLQQLRAECDRNCTSNFTTRATAGCISQCVQLYRDESAAASLSTSSATTAQPGGYGAGANVRNRLANRHYDAVRARSRGPLVASSKDPNEIQHLDELLDTEESQASGLYITHPRERYAPDASSGGVTKDLANSTSLGKINYRSNVIEQELRQTSTEKVYLKYAVTRTGPKVVGAKLNATPVEGSLEDADLTTYHQFGQKLRQSTIRREQNAPTVGPRKTPIQAMLINSRTPASKTDEDESVDTTIYKQPSKIRRVSPDGQRRNIVALTRKFGGTIPKSELDALVGLSSKSAEASGTELLKVAKREHLESKVPKAPAVEEIATQYMNSSFAALDTINRVENLAALTEDVPVPEETLSRTELLIHVPDPDPPSVTENELIPSSTKPPVIAESTTESQIVVTTPTTTTAIPVTAPSPFTTLRPPLSTTTTTTTTKPTTSASTTTTTTSTTTTSAPTTTTTSLPTTTPKPLPPTLPRPTPPPNYRHMEETPNLIVFNPVVPPKELLNPTNTTDQPNASSTPRTFTRTTVSSSVRSTINSRHRTKVPTPTPSVTPIDNTTPFDLKLLSNLTSFIAKGNFSDEDFKTLAKYFPNMTTKRPVASSSDVLRDDSDVTIEMHRMNMATYVLAGLGVFPIVAILLYLAKTVVFRKPPKSDADLERYIAEDLKKISPVVKIESSAGKPRSPPHQEGIYSEGSIMTEESFNRNLLKFKSLLGEGNFGQVWKAEADDLLGHMGTTRIVAVKTERCGMVNGGLQDEAAIMRKLGSHANVVTLLGACTTKEPHLLIMEFAMRGRLLSLLRAARNAKTNNVQMLNSENVHLAPLSPRRLAGFAHDIARGMEYISERKIVHRDLAARNVLLDHNGVCKICDFGMSIDLEKTLHLQARRKDIIHQQSSSPEPSRFRFDFHRRSLRAANEAKAAADCKRPALPIRWMAPEALQYHIFSSETDVWAFGIVLWEIATLGCTPYPTLSGRQVVRNIPTGTRPEIPLECRPEMYELMLRTWRKDPRLRPTFTEARLELSRALCQWEVNNDDDTSDYLDISGFSEDLEHGMVYFNRRIPEFECEI